MKINFESHTTPESLQEELREEFVVENGFELDHINDCYELEVVKTENGVVVGMLMVDTSPMDYFENDHGAGELVQFRSAYERDEAMEARSKSKNLMYLVDRYEHGQVHYSVSGTVNYPDDRWDVAHGCAVFVPSEDVQKAYKKEVKESGEDAARQKFIADSNKVLDNYSDWCNGEVYGYAVLSFDKSGKELNTDECWGYIGRDYANEEKRSVMKHVVLSEEVDKLMENVVIETLSPKEVDLPFKITKKGLESAKVAKVYDTYVVGAKYEGEDNVVVYNWSEGQEKPAKAKFEEWQKNYGTTAQQFLDARLNSDIGDVIKKELEKQEVHSLKAKM